MSDNSDANLIQLQERINYSFNNVELLINALTHRSYANEAQPLKVEDNERLEFLGDAILGMFISHYLMDKYPHYCEGKLSKLKSYLVSKSALANLARNLNLGEYLRLGRGEHFTCGQAKDSLLANTFEALIGAIYLDGGVEAAGNFILAQFTTILGCEVTDLYEVENYKGALQEFAQMKLGQTPVYKLVRVTGPEHRRIFEIQLKVNDEYCIAAQGHSKKQAEQEAARKLFQLLKLNYSPPSNSLKAV